MVLFQRWNIQNWRLLLCTVIGILIIGEYLIYFIVAMSWNVPVEKSEHDLRVLFISDPQIQVSKKDELRALQIDQIVGASVCFQLGHNWNPYYHPLPTIRCQQILMQTLLTAPFLLAVFTVTVRYVHTSCAH